MAELPKEPAGSEITPEGSYLRRRELMRNVGLAALTATGVSSALLALTGSRPRADRPPQPPGVGVRLPAASSNRPLSTDEPHTSYEDVTSYNNFYELGLGKSDPARNGDQLITSPWTVRVEGEVRRPATLDLGKLMTQHPIEERVYRLRCVEAWSMVIPWLGFSLASLIKQLEPTSRAKYVAFTTLLDPEQLPGQNDGVLDWPYVEALRIDEATHPLTLMAVGLYGKPLPAQNGAPLRLVVPWKYGFKSIKSIVKIAFTETRPPTTWNKAAPTEYGFYANVNPFVSHPRWSQATERRLGELSRRQTMAFNGYGQQVASLYSGLDLRKNF